MPELNDNVLRHMASQYVEEYGLRLQEELAGLGNENVLYATPGMDRRVLGNARAQKRRRAWRIAAAMAACLLLVLMAPLVLRRVSTSPAPAPQATQEFTMDKVAPEAAPEEEAPAEMNDALMGGAEPDLPNADAGGPDPATGGGDAQIFSAEPAENPTTAGGPTEEPDMGPRAYLEEAPEYAIIPLSFVLPADMEIIRIEQDNARSIYYLSDVKQSDIVLTLEETPRQPDTEGLGPIEIGEHLAYGIAGPDYSLLTFQKDGILYEMTCAHDMSTLLELSYNIL